ncbi:NifB/NifX family molybdenum-iron cluster-binding protein [Draconibacterium sediminis]|uniref:NifB/NifX family molybdenum-iron cluster-binding protein n=1 Tax=Draconibacterium sediminis TaxID=1544798 RepID=UPI0005D36C11|nr:NifB/NifX family molybdenum-iron cluster-binding protein [Draconibacterium sediminis]
MRIAVTTSNGEKVDQHFGKATRFDVYDVDGDEMKLVETREVTSYCSAGGQPVADHKFSSDRFSTVKEKLEDCEKLYTMQIGEKPKEQFDIIGIAVQTCTCSVDKIPGCSGKCK